MKKKALILDCDGVIVDSEPYSCGAWNVVFREKYGIEVGTNYESILGKRAQDSVQYYLDKYDLPQDSALKEDLIRLKEAAYYRLAKGILQPMEGVKECIKEARALGWKVAVASSGSMEKIAFSLKEVGLLDAFDIIVSGEEVKMGKPAPDLFNETIKRLGLAPNSCIIVEDSINGLIAAINSGGVAVGLVGTFTFDQLAANFPKKVIRSFPELDLNLI